jgi:hypothetical protein
VKSRLTRPGPSPGSSTAVPPAFAIGALFRLGLEADLALFVMRLSEPMAFLCSGISRALQRMMWSNSPDVKLFQLSPEQRRALVALDMRVIVAMGTHPLVPFLANLQIQHLRRKASLYPLPLCGLCTIRGED